MKGVVFLKIKKQIIGSLTALASAVAVYLFVGFVLSLYGYGLTYLSMALFEGVIFAVLLIIAVQLLILRIKTRKNTDQNSAARSRFLNAAATLCLAVAIIVSVAFVPRALVDKAQSERIILYHGKPYLEHGYHNDLKREYMNPLICKGVNIYDDTQCQ